jgi:hypothetical protein
MNNHDIFQDIAKHVDRIDDLSAASLIVYRIFKSISGEMSSASDICASDALLLLASIHSHLVAQMRIEKELADYLVAVEKL